MSFTPQLVIPKDGNPYYNTKSSGGYNPCIKGNPKSRKPQLNVLPNCVGYATGRFNEIGEWTDCKYLGNTNAANFITLARKQGLMITQRPTIGGCMVWHGGNTGEGHVAIVEMDLGISSANYAMKYILTRLMPCNDSLHLMQHLPKV